VFKVASAAAEEGLSLDEVERLARHANDRTRTLGVAFAGCTLPGAGEPLFAVPAGRMGLGLGIHGEPGVSEVDVPSAAELAERLVEGVVAELSVGTTRVGAILNGLGATKYEELFVVWKTVARLLAERGYTVVDPEVGELVTSLDMAGCSLTLVALDEELERFWCAPADTPAFRKAAASLESRDIGRRRSPDETVSQDPPAAARRAATGASAACAGTVLAALEQVAAAIVAAEEELGRLDAVAGDGDHGRGMVKGVRAALDAARVAGEQDAGVESLLREAGGAWAARAGGTSGALWGAGLAAVGGRLGDDAEEISAADVVDAIRAGAAAVQQLGHTELGDKTMLDALAPFLAELDSRVSGGNALADAWVAAAAVATTAAADTAPLRPRRGRARPLADRSVGTPDPGAVSLALSLRTIGEVLGRQRGDSSIEPPDEKGL